MNFKIHFPIPSSAAHLGSISKAEKTSSQIRLDYRRESKLTCFITEISHFKINLSYKFGLVFLNLQLKLSYFNLQILNIESMPRQTYT